MTGTTTESWIFLRGLARSSEHWGEFPERFKFFFPNAEIEVLDIAGNGSERLRPSFCTIERTVHDLRARSRLIKAGHQVSLLTISMGSMMGAAWADANPNEIKRLILINTSDRRQSSFFERLQPATYLPLLSMLVASGSRSREEKVLQLTTRILAPVKLHSVLDRHSLLRQTSVPNFFRQLWAASHYCFPKRPAVPTLILTGARDALAHPVCSKRLARSWDCPLLTHPEAGHDLPLDAPDWICEQVRSWLESSAPAQEI